MLNEVVSARLVRPATSTPSTITGLLHGLGSGTSVWEGLLPLLPPQLEVWAYQLPWDTAGGSGWAEHRDSRVWLERAFDSAPVRPELVVAHSFGANVLLDAICAGAARLGRGLVLISPFYRPAPRAFDWAAMSHYMNDFDELIRSGIKARRGPRLGTAFTSAGEDDLLEAMVAKVRERIGPYGWLRFFDLFTQTPFLDLSAVDVPCLVLGGGRDTAAYPADVRSLGGALPDAQTHILPDSGHFSMIDDTAGVAALAGPFLGGLSTGVMNRQEGSRT
ncbi:alpha/beta hydrolase [Micromonospora sp. NPDC049044]|uniref:alpha/beta fold hydrolase n=1 Tax=unclassified Micromonospora TaxID=2617518 RepID=UPI0033ED9AB0